MWLFSGVCWRFCLCGGYTASTRCPPSRETASAVWPEEPQTPLCSWGFILPTRQPPGIELQSSRLCNSPVLVLMEFKPSPFSLFSSVPVAVSTFPLFHFLSSCFWGGVLFPYSPPSTSSLCPLSAHKSTSLPATSRSPSLLLRTVYLLNSVVQVMCTVVLILR